MARPSEYPVDLENSIDQQLLIPQRVKHPERPKGWGARHTLTLWALLGFLNVYAMRVNLSIAMVAMVNTTDLEPLIPGNNSMKGNAASDFKADEMLYFMEEMDVAWSYSEIGEREGGGTRGGMVGDDPEDTCPDPVGSNTTAEMQGEFNWDEQTQGLILGAFFYGYLVTQIPGGWLATSLGGKRLFGLGILCTSVLTLITPLAARTSLYLLIAVRVLEGLGEGVTYPAMHALLGVWAPVYERSVLVVLTYSGAELGTVLSMPLSGLLCDSDFLGGWPSVFYIFGSFGVLWTVVWMFLVHDTPAKHPWIKVEERLYIESSIGTSVSAGPPPWGKILTSGAVWAIVIGNFSIAWGYYIFLTCLPTYMKDILKFDMKADSSLSAIPYAVAWLVKLVSSFLGDFLRSRGYLSTKNTRKLMTSLGSFLPAGLVLLVGYVGCNHVAAVLALALCVGTGGFGAAGYAVNHLDIAPKYAGILQGIVNSFATIPGFVTPLLVGILTNDNQTRGQWQIVFYITAAVYVVGAILYNLLAQGDVTSWGGLAPTTIIVAEPTTINEASSECEEIRHVEHYDDPIID